MNKKFAIAVALLLISIVCCAGCIDPQDPVDPITPVDPVDPITPVDPEVPELPVEEYSVMFMMNYDGAGAYTAETVKAGERVSKPANPSRSGYTFNGWFTEADGGAVYDFTQAINSDVTLYAQWSKKKSSSSSGSSTPSTPDATCSHNWGESDGWVVVKPATCTENGLKKRVCTLCSESETRVIDAGHNIGEYVVTTPATCIEDGEKVSICDVCGHAESRIITKLGHPDEDKNDICDICEVSLAKPEEGHNVHVFILESIEENVGTLKCNCGQTKTENYVAQVAGKYYTDIRWAINNASIENVLVLLDDFDVSTAIEINSPITINVNGKTVKLSYTEFDHIKILSSGTTIGLTVLLNGKTVVFGEKIGTDNIRPVIVAYTAQVITLTPTNAEPYQADYVSALDVYTAEGLMWTSELSKIKGFNSGEGRLSTITIMRDIDMAGLEYYPINSMWLIINGNQKTISNLNCLKSDDVGRSGFLAYAGGCTIKDLTLSGMTAAGTQVGAFAGSAEGATLENCKLTGIVELTWEQNPDGKYQETANGVGVFIGINAGNANTGTLSGGVVESNADITLDIRGMTTVSSKLSSFPMVGYHHELSSCNVNTEDGAKINILCIDGFNGELTETGILYTISNTDGFTYFANSVEEGYAYEGHTVELTTNIDLSEEKTNGNSFAPIGSTGERGGDNRLTIEPFKGTFDGQGHTISNLYQSGWDFGYEWGKYGSIGLFSELEGATVKNVVLEGFECQIEGGDISFIAGSATGDCTFENITIKNGKIGTYNNGIGGIIGWSGAGTYTFKNITIGSDVVLGGLWGSFDSSVGGIVGQAEPGATYNFENVDIACRLDVYNDCTASYDYYNYRMCGMIIGRLEETTTIDGTNYPDTSKYRITCTNVTVTYGDWANYHYCEPTPGLNGGRGMRVEPGYDYGGLPEDFDHTQCVDNHYNMIPFDQIFGGDQIGVKGLKTYDGVTVVYPAEYTCPLCGNQHNTP